MSIQVVNTNHAYGDDRLELRISDDDFNFSIKVTPEEVARMFWDMYSDQQAMFFNYLGYTCLPEQLPFQLQAITEEPKLTKKARWVMEMIGDYSSETLT